MKKRHCQKQFVALFGCCIGYIAQAVAVNLSPLFFIIFLEHYDMSFDMIGNMLLLNFTTQIVADILCSHFADRIGHIRLATISNVLIAIGMLMLGFAPFLHTKQFIRREIIASGVISAFGGGMTEVLMMPIAAAKTAGRQEDKINFICSFYCFGHSAVVVITSLTLLMVGEDHWNIIPILFSVIPISAAFLFARLIPCDIRKGTADYNNHSKTDRQICKIIYEKNNIKKNKHPRISTHITIQMFMICVVAFACCASEQIISQWSSGFIESEFSVSKLTGDIAGPCMFALMMGTVRIIYSQFGKGINLKSILFSSGISCFFCYLVISLSKSNFISLAMFAICGGAVGLMWPCILSVASKRQSKSDAKFFGIISTFGDLGCAIGPWLAGIVASKNELTGGMSKAILSFSFFPLIVAFGILIVMPKKRKHVCKINNKTSGIHEKFK